MRKRKTADDTSALERNPFQKVASSAQAIVTRYREALAQLEETPLPAELKGSLEAELAELLHREIRALCNSSVDGNTSERDLFAELPVGCGESGERSLAALGSVSPNEGGAL